MILYRDLRGRNGRREILCNVGLNIYVLAEGLGLLEMRTPFDITETRPWSAPYVAPADSCRL